MASEEFSAMVKHKQTRKKFINHAIHFLRFYNFDGIDLGNSKIFILNKNLTNPKSLIVN